MTKAWTPTIGTRCCDCGAGAIQLGEWYDVRDAVWELAWRGRRKSWHSIRGQAVLCIGCLEQRIGRTLCAEDFTDAPVNWPGGDISDRMRARLLATESVRLEPMPVPADGGPVVKRGRGRPKGSKNRPKVPEKRKRGRPLGSKNKPKVGPDQAAGRGGPTASAGHGRAQEGGSKSRAAGGRIARQRCERCSDRKSGAS
jgi:hypothetical protein